jgi:hypothetical protein
MQDINAYVAQLQESFKKLIDTFKKYKIRHIPNVGENFIEIAFMLDDIYESVCREMRDKYNIQCVRIKDYYAYTLITKSTIDSIKYELTSVINSMPYQLHPEFSVKDIDPYTFMIIVAIFDDDVISAIQRQISIDPRANMQVKVEKFKINKVVWVKIIIEW